MTSTFLVEVDVPLLDPQSLLNEAADIEDDLIAQGHDVRSVKPYARPSIGLTSQQIQATNQQPNL